MSGRVAILLVLLFFAKGFAEETVEIPLSEVWSYDRARSEFEPEHFIKFNSDEEYAKYSSPEKQKEIQDKAESSLTWQIEKAMNDNVLNLSKHRDPMKAKPATCFAVSGVGYQALQHIYNVVVRKQKPQTKFLENEKISFVFFALMSRPQPHLSRIERNGKTIIVEYVIPPDTRDIRHVLLVIPIGQLEAGKYQINPVRAYKEEQRLQKLNPRDGVSPEAGLESICVCQSLGIEVVAEPTQRKEELPK